jgi:hypothetical protein
MQHWLADNPGKEKLWISGLAGCGKSFLAEQVLTKLHDGKTSTQHGVVHCWLSDSDPSRGDLEALLRATLHQALHLVPELVDVFLLPTFEAAQGREYDEQEIWTRTVLTTIWVNAMAEIMARRSLTLVIDGLDEIGRECQETFFDFLDELPQKTQEAFERLKGRTGESRPPKIKLLALSRKDGYLHERLGRLGFKSYEVEPKDIKEDIKKTARAGLSALRNARGRSTDTRLEEICNKIADYSHGSYLWASLVVEILTRARITSETYILSLLEGYAAGDVDKLYTHILLGINKKPTNAAFVRQVLRWAIFQQEGLKLSEFGIADALAKATAQHPGQTITPEILTACLDDRIKLRVEFHCGHLVKFQDDGRLSLTHRALKHHLTTQDTRSTPSSSNRSPSNPNDELFLDRKASHASLANICIAYLTMPCFGTSIQPERPLPLAPLPPSAQYYNPYSHYTTTTTTTQLTNHPHSATPTPPTSTHTDTPTKETPTNKYTSFESRIRHLIKAHPFLRYASLHWHQHLAAAGAAWPTKHDGDGDGDEALQVARRGWLEDETSAYARCWSEVWWFFVRGVVQPYPEGAGLAGRVVRGFQVGGGGEGVKVGDRVGVERGRRDKGEEQGRDDDGSSFYSCGGQPETLDTNAPGGLGGLGVSLQGTAKGKAQKGGREMAKGELVEKEVVSVERIAFVDPPMPKGVITEKITQIEMVENIREVKVEVEKIKEVHVEVDKTPPKKEKARLGKWNRVKKIGWKLGKFYTTLTVVEKRFETDW